MRIGVDLDEVLWEMLTPWVDIFNETTGENIKVEDIKEYDISRYIKNPENEKVLYELLSDERVWERSVPLEDSVKHLKKLNDEHDVYIITATSSREADIKFRYFREHFPFIEGKQIIRCYNKQMMDVDIMIDDNPENLVGGKYHKILVDKPYNRKSRLNRCRNWGEIAEEVERWNNERQKQAQ